MISFDNLPPLHIERYKDGSGMIVFAAQSEPYGGARNIFMGIWLDEKDFAIGPIAGVNEVLALIQAYKI